MLSGVSLVSIHVKNQDKALKFYTEKLGFKLDVDAPFGEGQRWIELTLADSPVRVALYTMEGQEDRIGTPSNIVFACKDIQKTYKEFSSKGVEFVEKPQKQSWGGTTARFKDVDGNTFCLCSMEETKL